MDLRDPEELAGFVAFLRDQLARVEQASYYEILGLTPDATTPDVRTNYYKLAGRYHPDLYAALLPAADRTVLVTLYARIVEAYQTLSNGQKRTVYDRNLSAGKLRYTTDDERGEQLRSHDPEFANASTKRFYQMALQAVSAGRLKSAAMNLKMALGLEPGNKALVDELARVEEALRAEAPPEGSEP